MTLVLVPLAIVAAAPQTSARLLGRAGDWLGSHHRAVTVGLCFGFGALLLIKGLAALQATGSRDRDSDSTCGLAVG